MHKVNCPSCATELSIPTSYLGKKVNCLSCQQSFEVVIEENPPEVAHCATPPSLPQQNPQTSNDSALLVDCPACGLQISKTSDKCIHCGHTMKQETSTTKSCLISAGILGGAMLLSLSTCIGSGSPKKEKTPVQAQHDDFSDSVQTYVKQRLKDPDSYQSISWSKVTKEKDGRYTMWHKYRAKNSFGGYVTEMKLFYLNQYGSILEVK